MRGELRRIRSEIAALLGRVLADLEEILNG